MNTLTITLSSGISHTWEVLATRTIWRPWYGINEDGTMNAIEAEVETSGNFVDIEQALYDTRRHVQYTQETYDEEETVLEEYEESVQSESGETIMELKTRPVTRTVTKTRETAIEIPATDTIASFDIKQDDQIIHVIAPGLNTLSVSYNFAKNVVFTLSGQVIRDPRS